MAWSFQNVAYGWRIGIAAVLTGTTIFVVDNIRYRIMQKDAVQVIMGTIERCMATQTGTNADGTPIYAVAPPSVVRSWYSNDYVATVTNGVTNWTAVLYTNVFTNVIGDRLDHALLVEIDAKIQAICPYYVDTNSVYDGTTNIVMLTFTGLLTSLDLGDHTNFTSIPSWTNNVGQTNCTTNAATYGPWAWRNYIVAWQERYKVLNALSARSWRPDSCDFNYNEGSDSAASWSNAQAGASNSYVGGGYVAQLTNWSLSTNLGLVSIFAYYSYGNGNPTQGYTAYLFGQKITLGIRAQDTNITVSCDMYIKSAAYGDWVYDEQGSGLSEPTGWRLLESIPAGTGVIKSSNSWGYDMPIDRIPTWCDTPLTNVKYRGYFFDVTAIPKYNFQYCTNKYW